ncbi:hypothetical protein KAJ41_00240 [Candidatus Parcubacteria bacterium]|nr:hypothetical protein [Candidatus Parcubacteria bacterium]
MFSKKDRSLKTNISRKTIIILESIIRTLVSMLVLLGSMFFWTILKQLDEVLYLSGILYLTVLCLAVILSIYTTLTYEYKTNELIVQANIVKNSRRNIEELKKKGMPGPLSEILQMPVNVLDVARKDYSGTAEVSAEFVTGINRATRALKREFVS